MIMNAKETKALERLTPKLSALRKTLRGEERKLLDRMVLGMTSEVSAHSARVGQKIPASKTPSAQPRGEVSLHSASVGQKIPATKTPSAQPRFSEVSLHSASVGQKIPASKTPSADARIELDASKGVYRITTI
jgi:hypothetical protein